MFIAPAMLSQASSPTLVIGEAKSFNLFESRDFERARQAAELFPGAVLCFATFRDQLTPGEKRRMRALVTAGRESLEVGRQINPVLILTGTRISRIEPNVSSSANAPYRRDRAASHNRGA
jgi:hypothetical protein